MILEQNNKLDIINTWINLQSSTHANSPLFLEIKTTNFPVELFCLEILFEVPLFFNGNKLFVFKRNVYLTVKPGLPQ